MSTEFNSDDELAGLEKALGEMRPAKPSASLEAKIFAIFDDTNAQPATRVIPLPGNGNGKILHWFRPIAAAAAVAAVFLGGVWLFREPGNGGNGATASISKPAATTEGQYQPVSAGNVFESATDEGVVYPFDGNEPMRRVRYHYHDTYEWRHPEDGSLIRLAVPQQELLYLPVETD